ncbi:MAG: DUF167 domain-containing protein [Thiobacillaceae bacterium]
MAKGGCTLRIHVQPGAVRSEVAGRHGDALKLRLAAPAVEGAANAALIEYLAARLNLPRREVTIAQGEKSRRKLVRVPLDPAEVERRLEMRAQES